MKRCPWANISPIDQAYHDNEWGVPVFDDQKLFENLTLEGAQAGLSWSTVLKKREGYRKAFANFNIETVANFDEEKIDRLLLDSSIIRHRLKIVSTVKNANKIIELQHEFGSFSTFIWQFVDGKPQLNHWQNISQVPNETQISQQMSKALKKRGFSFAGSTICYAFMQASGLVNDHLTSCICRQ